MGGVCQGTNLYTLHGSVYGLGFAGCCQEDGQRHLERLRSLEASDIKHEFKQSIKETIISAFYCLQVAFLPLCVPSIPAFAVELG